MAAGETVVLEYGSIVEWAVALMTLAALCLTAWQLRQNAKSAGQSHARQAWMAYLQLGAQYPQFGSTGTAMRLLKIDSVDELYKKGNLETEIYWWFLDIMLKAMEALVVYFPEDEWENTIKFNLELHREAIEYRWREIDNFYSASLCRIAERVPNAPT